jgi:hypothetical protein
MCPWRMSNCLIQKWCGPDLKHASKLWYACLVLTLQFKFEHIAEFSIVIPDNICLFLPNCISRRFLDCRCVISNCLPVLTIYSIIKYVALLYVILKIRILLYLNYRIIIVNTVQFDSIYIYVLPLHDSVSWPSSEGIRTTFSDTTTCKGNKYL